MFKKLIGKTVKSFKEKEKDEIESKYGTSDRYVFTLTNGKKFLLELAGDCCSKSFFENPEETFRELVGATILDVEERDGDIENDGALKWHFLVFKTDKGHVTVEWRNESNGYYDGWAHCGYPYKENES